MLTAADNRLLTRTGPGTPMGELFRRFWLPALLPSELPEPDCAPVRLKMLGEDLIAWRNTDGSYGVMQNACPHRGASMFFGRNEENGLRCVYHGWKFDTEGQCVDMPNEPAESNFKHKIKAAAYPAAHWGGFIWVYMGPKAVQPELPHYDWCITENPDRTYHKWMQESNYLQGLEGNIDSSHASFLHRFFDFEHDWNTNRTRRGTLLFEHGAPLLTAKETEFGFIYGAQRTLQTGEFYWRVTPYVLPVYTVIPNPGGEGGGFFVLPRDDESSWWFTVSPRGAQLAAMPNAPKYVELELGSWRQSANKDNDYLIDREAQRKVNYTGLPTNRVQDGMVTESMGVVMDRTAEHLASADLAIIFMRRLLLKLARQLAQGIEPEVCKHPEFARVWPIDAVNTESNLGDLWQRHHATVFSEEALKARG